MKFLLRVVELFELLAALSIIWGGLRDIVFPDGTTTPQVLMIFILFAIWEDVLRIKIRLGS